MLDRRAFLVAGGSSLALLGRMRRSARKAQASRGAPVRGMSANDPDLAAMRRAVAAMKAAAAVRSAQLDPLRRHPPQFLSARQTGTSCRGTAPTSASFERICRELSGKSRLCAAVLELDRGPAIPGGVRRRRPQLQSAVSSAARRRQRPAARRRHGRSGGDVGHHDQSGFRSFRQHAAARPEQRRRVMAAAGSVPRPTLEFNPHDGVHQAIGGNMSVVALSARDPIFFLHHANVDRLWSAWNRRGNANSPEPMWRDFAFNGNFIDARRFAVERQRRRSRFAGGARLPLRRR